MPEDMFVYKYHLIAFALGFFLDQLIGDPMNFPHPIRLIGNLIGSLDRILLGNTDSKDRDSGSEKRRGVLLCFLVVLITAVLTAFVMMAAYFFNRYIGIAAEAVLTCYILAAKSLKDESMKVYHAIEGGTLEDARKAVSMIVGRDTDRLDEKGIVRATVETVAENTSDGVIAPLIFTFIGGPILGFMYKAINTMDSMVGYHNDRYEHFGWAPAKLDDIVNFLPARISAVLMIIAAFAGGREFSGRDALRVFIRDRYNHKSPNSAQTESACAGALGLRLGGDSYYFGRLVHKPTIGDAKRQEERGDIRRSCRLMYLTVYITFAVLMIVGMLIYRA
jgi:adenosylcobinamide-phosphate synthase